MIKYDFPCYPGDEVWYIECYNGRPLCLGKRQSTDGWLYYS